MASKNSGRYSGVLALLNVHRNVPKDHVLVPDDKFAEHVAEHRNTVLQLLVKYKEEEADSVHVTSLLETCLSLGNTALEISSIRVNKYGKFEVKVQDLVQALRALKASPEEIENIAWQPLMCAPDSPQAKFLSTRMAGLGLNGNNDLKEAQRFYILVYSVTRGKKTASMDKDPLWYKYQFVTKLISPLDARHWSTSNDAVAPPSPAAPKKRKAAAVSASVSPDASPPVTDLNMVAPKPKKPRKSKAASAAATAAENAAMDAMAAAESSLLDELASLPDLDD